MNIEKRAVLQAITSYIPLFVVQETLRNPGLPPVHGQFLCGTLLFADVSGFTAMSEKLSEVGKEGAEELTRILNSYFSAMLDIAESYGGDLLKFGGDAMLILFHGKEHAARSVYCAQRMQKAMTAFSRLTTTRGVFQLRMSIGINSGEFFLAGVGTVGDRMACVFTGRMVNQTAVVETAASATEIFIGPLTYGELQGRVTVVPQGEFFRVDTFQGRPRMTQSGEALFQPLDLEGAIEVLGSYLPPRLTARIKLDPDRPGAEGEHRKVTMMFVNLLGSTELVDNFGKGNAGRITEALNQYFLLVQNTVNKYGGLVIGWDLNNTGDKLLIIFGAPVSHEDDDERAVLCALEMRQLLAQSGLPLRQRTGINAGHVFCGEVGGRVRREYTVMGDAVNLAARLMGVASEGEVVIGHSSYSKVAGKFVADAREPVKVKGKQHPVAAYSIHAVKPVTVSGRQVVDKKIIGRDKEMAVLQEVAGRGVSGQGQLVSIHGPTGIGKSRLSEEFKLMWERRGGLSHSGACQSFGADTPYLPWVGVLSSIIGIEHHETGDQRASRIKTAISILRPQLEHFSALLGRLLQTPMEESSLLKSLDSKLRHQRLLDLVLELVQAQSEKTPLLLVFEDLQWSDRPSMEMLNYLVRNIKGYPLAICAVYRPELPVKLETQEVACTEIALTQLSPEATVAIAESALQMPGMPPELGRLIVERSQGNPLYVEELVRSLAASGYMRLSNETGQMEIAEDVSQLRVPDTIEGVIMARIDLLAEKPREVLKAASVIGRTFSVPLLKQIRPSGVTDRELGSVVADLVQVGMITPGPEKANPEYQFVHIMTQEVAYESLLFSRRRQIHHDVAAYLEESFSGHLEDQYEILFYHYDRTADKGKGFTYAIKAGDKVKKVFANQEAIKYFSRALALAAEVKRDTLRLRNRVQEDLGDIYQLVGSYDLALECYAGCLQRYREVSVPGGDTGTPGELSLRDKMARHVPVLHRKSGLAWECKGDYDQAVRWLRNGLEVPVLAVNERASLNIAMAGVLYRKGEYTRALWWCQRGVSSAAAAHDLSEMAHSYYLLGTINTDLGRVDKAIGFRLESLRIYEELRDLLGQAKVQNNLGVDYYYQGDWERSKERYNKSLEIRKKIGDINGMATVSNNLGEVLSDQGYLDEAVTAFSNCLKTWQRTGYLLGIGLAHSNLGRAQVRQGNLRDGMEHLESSLSLFEKMRSKGFIAENYLRLGEGYLCSGQLEKARDYGERALTLANEQKLGGTEAASLRVLGQARRMMGDIEGAERCLKESARLLRRLNMPFELGKTLWESAVLGSAPSSAGRLSGNPDELGSSVQEALGIFRRLGVLYQEAEAQRLASSLH